MINCLDLIFFSFTNMPKDTNELAQRMKSYEKQWESNLDPTLPFLIRLDGHCFSKFTKQFDKPFDTRIHYAMAGATADLLCYFNCTTGFTQSDEITLVFPAYVTEEDLEYERENPNKPKKAMPFNGRIQKIASLAAGYCSVRFNYHLQAQGTRGSDKDKVKENIVGLHGFFDARVFSVPRNDELLNNIMWRSRYDCERNSTAMLAQAHFSAKALHGLSRKQQKQKLLDEKNIDWEDQPNWFKYGALIKKELYEKEAINPKTQETLTVTRTRVICKSFQLSTFSENLVKLLLDKYWGETPLPDLPIQETPLEN